MFDTPDTVERGLALIKYRARPCKLFVLLLFVQISFYRRPVGTIVRPDDVCVPKLGGILTGSRKVAVKPQNLFVDIRVICRPAFAKLTSRGSEVILLLFDSNTSFGAMADVLGQIVRPPLVPGVVVWGITLHTGSTGFWPALAGRCLARSIPTMVGFVTMSDSV